VSELGAGSTPRIAGTVKILVKARGSDLQLPDLPVTAPITAQLIADDGTTRECWQAEFNDIRHSDQQRFVAKGE
jgi:hypothetical protein